MTPGVRRARPERARPGPLCLAEYQSIATDDGTGEIMNAESLSGAVRESQRPDTQTDGSGERGAAGRGGDPSRRSRPAASPRVPPPHRASRRVASLCQAGDAPSGTTRRVSRGAEWMTEGSAERWKFQYIP